MLIASALLLAGGGWLHLDALKRSRSHAWQQGAEHICAQVAQGRPSRVVGGQCQIQIGKTWHGHPGMVSGGKK